MLKAHLRLKILLPLLALSILPLLGTILVISQMTQHQIEKAMEIRKTDVSKFVERTTTYAQLEKFNYIQLMARNEALASAIGIWKETGNEQSLTALLENLAQKYRFDILELLDTGGDLVFRFSRDEDITPSTTKDHPIIQASLEDDPYYDVSTFDGRLAIMAASPVRHGSEIIGHIVGAGMFNERFANTLKSGTGAEIAFFQGGSVIGASHLSLAKIDVDEVLNGGLSRIEIEGQPHGLFTNSLSGADNGVVMALNQAELLSAISTTRRSLWFLLVGAGTLALVAGIILAYKISTPLRRVVASLQSMAEGEGDLTRDLVVASRDEVGELASNFNRFVRRLREMVRRTRTVSADLAEVTERVRTASGEVNDGANRQSKVLDESFQAIQGIETSISGIAESTGSLLISAEESSSATHQMGSTNEQIAAQMEKLFATVEEVTSSISEMSQSIQQVGENIDVLSSSTEMTAAAITELDASIKEIEENAEHTRRLSEEAAKDAQEGKNLVDDTVEGIEAVRQTVDHASAAIQELGNRSADITRILTVIDEVADQTNLLALNAAIISAQAGEHGKGFAVVADEIRELSERTAVSTREIAAIIDKVQSGTADAVSIMKEGSEKVHQEAGRSRKAGSALEKIRASTLKSLEQVSEIVRATQEQSRGSRQITASINQVASNLDQIAAAVRQQTDGGRQLARATEAMKDIAYQGKNGTAEQAEGSRQINENMERIRAMIERIDQATREQKLNTQQVVEAVSKMREIAEGNASRIADLDHVVEILSRQTTALEEEVGAFKA